MKTKNGLQKTPRRPNKSNTLTQYIDVKQTIKRLELELIALQGIPNRLEQAKEIYGSLSTPGRPPGPNLEHKQESKFFRMSGTDSKEFYIQYIPISYDIPADYPKWIQLKTSGHTQIDLNQFPPHIKKTQPMDTNTCPQTTIQHSRWRHTILLPQTTKTCVQTERNANCHIHANHTLPRIRPLPMEQFHRRNKQQLDNILHLPISNKPIHQHKSNSHRPTEQQKHTQNQINGQKGTRDTQKKAYNYQNKNTENARCPIDDTRNNTTYRTNPNTNTTNKNKPTLPTTETPPTPITHPITEEQDKDIQDKIHQNTQDIHKNKHHTNKDHKQWTPPLNPSKKPSHTTQLLNKQTPRQFNSENRRNTIGSPRKNQTQQIMGRPSKCNRHNS